MVVNENLSTIRFPALDQIPELFIPSTQATTVPTPGNYSPILGALFGILIFIVFLIFIIALFLRYFEEASTFDRWFLLISMGSVAVFLGFSMRFLSNIAEPSQINETTILMHNIYPIYITASVTFLSITFAGFAIIASLLASSKDQISKVLRKSGFFDSAFKAPYLLILAPIVVIFLSIDGLAGFPPYVVDIIFFSVSSALFLLFLSIIQVIAYLILDHIMTEIRNDEKV